MCQSLGRWHGLSSRLATNTDAAFLAVLGDAQAREEPAEVLCLEALPAVCFASTNSTEEERKRRKRFSLCDWSDCCGCCECCDACDCC